MPNKPKDPLSYEDRLRAILDKENKGLFMPKVSPGDWITVGNRNAVVCNVFNEPGPQGAHIEVVYLDDRDRAINVDVKWSENGWKFPEGMGGGYADKYSRLQPYVSKLRYGRRR